MTDLRNAMQQEPRRRGPNKRKRRERLGIEMDYEQTILPVHIYQHWLQDASDIVSRRGRKKKVFHMLFSISDILGTRQFLKER